jgi:hypothetical protein
MPLPSRVNCSTGTSGWMKSATRESTPQIEILAGKSRRRLPLRYRRFGLATIAHPRPLAGTREFGFEGRVELRLSPLAPLGERDRG